MRLIWLVILMLASASLGAQERSSAPASEANPTVAQLISALRGKAKALETSAGMRLGFQSFTSAYKVPPETISYSDYVMARLLYEATRDAGFWNLHWTITDRQPESDNIWRQWQSGSTPWFTRPTASAECDELSALYAFLAGRAGVRGMGLLWPTTTHTVAVWVLRPKGAPPIRVVVPTSQIFLDVNDSFGTRKFDPWGQRSIHEYTRRDVPDSASVPKPLYDFFLQQVDKYAGATDSTLQQLRYLREWVFLRSWTPQQAAQDAIRRRNKAHSDPPEDLAAFQNFAHDMGQL